jgi:hypothetical protein
MRSCRQVNSWPTDLGADMKQPSLDRRHRDKDGREIRRKNGNAVVDEIAGLRQGKVI